MRIGCLQFSPQVGDVNNNLNRADAVLSKGAPDDLDLLVLPELAFSGYNFKSLQEITPFLEPSGSGITSLWARTIALKYDCSVLAGYPEKVDVSPKWPTGPEYYNSAILVNGDGETVANYRKSFLYYTDESWALEGNGFYGGWIPGFGNTAMGICMDLNPYKFEAPWHAFEFAFHILEMQANLVIVSMAWMTREEPRQFSRMPNEPDLNTLTYWVARLEPLIRAESEDEIIVVFCNRTGVEDDAIYAGTSAVIGIQAGEVKVYGVLGRGQRELLVVDTADAPYAKLVHRPDGDAVESAADEHDTLETQETIAPPSDAASAPASQNDDSMEAGVEATPAKQEVTQSPQLSSVEESRDNSSHQDIGLSGATAQPVDGTSKAALDEAPGVAITKTEPSNIPDDYVSPMPPTDASKDSPATTRPSHFPTATRPKLIIPKDSPQPPPQLYPDSSGDPMSAASAISERSIQSVKSDESEASTMTVRSNPRPPEDSTPYPYSGAPLSGYPANSTQTRKQIYGGSVTIKTDDFTPITVFDDVSPVSSRGFWGSSDIATRTPISAGGWVSTAVGRQPGPFPWEEIRDKSRTGMKKVGQNSSPPPPPRATPLSQTTRSIRKSPHLRSQTRLLDTSTLDGHNPSWAQQARVTSVDHHRRSDSATRPAEATGNARAASARNPSPFGRVSQPWDYRRRTSGAQQEPLHERSSIPIIASPSILERKADRRAVIPTPVAVDYYRTAAVNIRARDDVSQSSSKRGTGGTSTRTPSRGRRTDREDAAHSQYNQRPSSTDSTRNDILHHKIKRPSPESHGNQRTSNSTSRSVAASRDGLPRASQEFERVEEVVCPSCPVHGSRSGSAAAEDSRSTTGNAPPRRGRSASIGVERSRAIRDDSADIAPTGHVRHKMAATSTEGRGDCRNEQTGRSERLGRQQYTASPIRRPTTAPSNFNPPTPRAMRLIDCHQYTGSADIESMEKLDLAAESEDARRFENQVKA